MKTLILTASIAIGLAASAQAGGRDYSPSWGGHVDTVVSQNQGQHQSNKQSQSNKQANSNNSQYKSTSVSAPGITGGGQSVCISGGWATGAGGVCVPTRHSKVIAEASAVSAMGGNGMAHLCTFNRRIARSQPQCRPAVQN